MGAFATGRSTGAFPARYRASCHRISEERVHEHGRVLQRSTARSHSAKAATRRAPSTLPLALIPAPAPRRRAAPPVLPEAKYAASHEWAKVEGNTATVGISDHAQQELGDVVYVELPEVGATVTKGETFGVVESVKVRTCQRGGARGGWGRGGRWRGLAAVATAPQGAGGLHLR